MVSLQVWTPLLWSQALVHRLGGCPQLDRRDDLQLVNLQPNGITQIQPLWHLHTLVLLNLSDSSLCEGLASRLCPPQALMLGKTRWVRPGGVPAAAPTHQRQLILVASPQAQLSSFRMDTTPRWMETFASGLSLFGSRIQEMSRLASLLDLKLLDLHDNQVAASPRAPPAAASSLAESLRRRRIFFSCKLQIVSTCPPRCHYGNLTAGGQA